MGLQDRAKNFSILNPGEVSRVATYVTEKELGPPAAPMPQSDSAPVHVERDGEPPALSVKPEPEEPSASGQDDREDLAALAVDAVGQDVGHRGRGRGTRQHSRHRKRTPKEGGRVRKSRAEPGEDEEEGEGDKPERPPRQPRASSVKKGKYYYDSPSAAQAIFEVHANQMGPHPEDPAVNPGGVELPACDLRYSHQIDDYFAWFRDNEFEGQGIMFFRMNYNDPQHICCPPAPYLDPESEQGGRLSRACTRLLRHDSSTGARRKAETIHVDRGGLADIRAVARRLNISVAELIEVARQSKAVASRFTSEHSQAASCRRYSLVPAVLTLVSTCHTCLRTVYVVGLDLTR